MIRKFFIAITAFVALSFQANAADKCSFPGGDEALAKWLADNMRYPSMCIDNAIEGTVSVTFTVHPTGKITNPSIVRKLDPDLEAEALRLVSIMPDWTPATADNGSPVSSSYTLPITFNLPD